MRYVKIPATGPFPRPVIGYVEATEIDPEAWAHLGVVLVPVAPALADLLRTDQDGFEAREGDPIQIMRRMT